MSEIKNVTGYKLNVQKAITFFYPSNKQLKNEIKKTIVYRSIKVYNILQNTFNTVFDFYTENYKTAKRNQTINKL